MQQGVHLSDALVAFIEGGVSISAASCGAGGLTVGRALACRAAPDRTAVTVYFAGSANTALLDAIARSGSIAVVFSEPSSHRSVQLKGSGARLAAVDDAIEPVLAGHAAAFARDLAGIGFGEAFARTLLFHEPGDVTAVAFAPSGAFSQTPGPKAGSPLET